MQKQLRAATMAKETLPRKTWRDHQQETEELKDALIQQGYLNPFVTIEYKKGKVHLMFKASEIPESKFEDIGLYQGTIQEIKAYLTGVILGSSITQKLNQKNDTSKTETNN